jgi:hypothetical protein
MAYDTALLRSALSALGSADSDGDGASDSDELKTGSDPNVSLRSTMQLPLPSMVAAVLVERVYWPGWHGPALDAG